jgi:hypothetical protein
MVNILIKNLEECKMADEIVTTTPAADTSAVTPATTDTPAIAPADDNTNTVVQTDTEKAIIAVEIALESLKTASGDLITAEITTLEATLANLKIKAEAEAKEIETEVEKIPGELMTFEQTFTQKYGTAIAHGAEIILLIYIAGRLANLF